MKCKGLRFNYWTSLMKYQGVRSKNMHIPKIQHFGEHSKNLKWQYLPFSPINKSKSRQIQKNTSLLSPPRGAYLMITWTVWQKYGAWCSSWSIAGRCWSMRARFPHSTLSPPLSFTHQIHRVLVKLPPSFGPNMSKSVISSNCTCPQVPGDVIFQ